MLDGTTAGVRWLGKAFMAAIVVLAVIPAAAMADGVGTATVSPTTVIRSSAGHTITFTFTAGETVTNGSFSITVPAGWTAPSTTGGAAGYSVDDCSLSGDIVMSDKQTVEVRGVDLSPHQTCHLTYGSGGGSQGATAPASPGAYQFVVGEYTSKYDTAPSSTNPPAIPSSPTIQVTADGTGTMAVSPTHAVAGSSGNTLTFTYTPTVNMTSGQINLAVPLGWSPPTIGGSGTGASTSTCGTVSSVLSSTIQVTGVTKTSGTACTITYSHATAPTSGGSDSFTTSQKATSGGTVTTLSSSPSVLVTAADGTGTMGVSPNTVVPGSTGNVLTFTYTAPSGGLSNGVILLTVPLGWTAPNLNSTAAGGINDQCGLGGHSLIGGGRTFRTTGVTLSPGNTCTISYGYAPAGGASAPTTPGQSEFTTSEASNAAGTPNPIAQSPVVRVGNDGTGTMTVSPNQMTAGSAGLLTFTYTAANSMSSGQLTLAVPAGWSTPTLGAVSSTCGTVGLSGSTIQVTGVTMSNGQLCTISYHGTAPGPGGSSYTFSSQQESSSDNDLLALASSPSVLVNHAKQPPTMCVVPTLKGKTLSQARTLLANAHCSLGKVSKPKKKKHHKLVVGSTSPPAGTKLPAGSNVALKLVKKK